MQVVRAEDFDRPEPPHALPLPLDGAADEPAVYPLVMVEWHDAWFDFELAEADEARPEYVVRTIGFLVSEGPRAISLAQEVLPDGEGFRAVTHIPLPVVERIVHLGPGVGPSPA